jgi:hypothetical protein
VRAALDNSGQFHPIVRRVRCTALQYALVITAAENASPSTWARISEATTIDNDFNVAHSFVARFDCTFRSRLYPRNRIKLEQWMCW